MLPVKCSSEDEVVVYVELVQSLCEIALVDETTSFVDYNQGVNDPGCEC